MLRQSSPGLHYKLQWILIGCLTITRQRNLRSFISYTRGGKTKWESLNQSLTHQYELLMENDENIKDMILLIF